MSPHLWNFAELVQAQKRYREHWLPVLAYYFPFHQSTSYIISASLHLIRLGSISFHWIHLLGHLLVQVVMNAYLLFSFLSEYILWSICLSTSDKAWFHLISLDTPVLGHLSVQVVMNYSRTYYFHFCQSTSCVISVSPHLIQLDSISSHWIHLLGHLLVQVVMNYGHWMDSKYIKQSWQYCRYDNMIIFTSEALRKVEPGQCTFLSDDHAPCLTTIPMCNSNSHISSKFNV